MDDRPLTTSQAQRSHEQREFVRVHDHSSVPAAGVTFVGFLQRMTKLDHSVVFQWPFELRTKVIGRQLSVPVEQTKTR